MAPRNAHSFSERLAAHETELDALRRDVRALQATPLIPGPQGAPGKDGHCRCTNGKDGAPGAPGRNGTDGVGSVGPQGRQGVDGKDSIASPERVANLETTVSQLRAENEARSAEIAVLKAALQAIEDRDKQTGEYMQWLRAKAAAREKK
jgi:hypothetical protein